MTQNWKYKHYLFLLNILKKSIFESLICAELDKNSYMHTPKWKNSSIKDIGYTCCTLYSSLNIYIDMILFAREWLSLTESLMRCANIKYKVRWLIIFNQVTYKIFKFYNEVQNIYTKGQNTNIIYIWTMSTRLSLIISTMLRENCPQYLL
jgi:hypothetical protein